MDFILYATAAYLSIGAVIILLLTASTRALPMLWEVAFWLFCWPAIFREPK